MAPKEPFKVHSLSKHIEETKKGMSAEKQFNKTNTSKSKPLIKKKPLETSKSIVIDSSDSDSSSESDSDSDDGADFLSKLATPSGKAAPRHNKQDEIADSDVERKASQKTKAVAAKSAKVKKEESSSESSSSDSDSDSDSGSDSDEKKKAKPQTQTKKVVKRESTTTSATSSSGSDSSSDDSDSEPAPAKQAATQPKEKKAIPAKAKPVKKESSENEDTSSEESSSESESEPEPAPKKAVKPAKATAAPLAEPKKKQKKVVEPESSSEESDDEEEDKGKKSTETSASSEAESADSDSDVEMETSIEVVHRQKKTTSLAPFTAPGSNFVLRKSQGTDGQDVASLCSEANLNGKQLWYFTVPANVPISVVEDMEIPMNAGEDTTPSFTHDGDNYGLAFDRSFPKSSIQILIPSADGGSYQSARKSVDQVMQVRRITQLSSTIGPDEAAAIPSSRQVRPQPKGLKMRFQPIGVSSPVNNGGSIAEEDEDVEMDDAKPAPKKRKQRVSTAVADGTEAPKKKKTKKQPTLSDDEDAAAAEQLMGENLSHSLPPSSMPQPDTPQPSAKSASKSKKGAKETPVPVPYVPSQPKETPVPLPFGVSSQPSAPDTPTVKKSKKSKTVFASQP
ncbi:hypothetical protein VHEMI07581 [[Torrubiella] hemipterigena]|uniref:RNA polymerase I, subunit RPA34.5 n=1 Tax=[Torrubiella] hemipterigena TaxID=1531966 RepID=A0A0A1TN68_9HYPO|nr:hypothetical protein VHEMI07581 [[Torrubiella] hemipterigena]